MTKSELVVQLQKIIGEEKVSKSECDRIWDGILEVIVEEVKAGGEIKFGSLFKVFKKHKNDRKVRNPKTGETFTKPARDELGCKVMREGKTIFE
jgi:nucleoid DNA-binding protein